MTPPVPNFETIKMLPLEPVCSPKEAKEKFEGHYLERGHVKYRLTESTHVVTPAGETKFLYLKRALPEALVARTWRSLQDLNPPAKNFEAEGTQRQYGRGAVAGID